MLQSTQPIIMLRKSVFSRFKQNYVALEERIAQYALSYYCKKPYKRMCLNGLEFKPLTNKLPHCVNWTKSKYIFEERVNHINLMVITIVHSVASKSVPFLSTGHVKRNGKIFILNDFTNTSRTIPVINRRYFVTECSCPPPTVGRHHYHEETENAVNHQILAELNACYGYLSMACYFGRTEIALPGCYGYFMNMHHEEYEHTLIFINYQLMRGGHVKLCPLTVPECQNWEGILRALAVAVEMEKLVKEKLEILYNVAEKHRDLDAMDLVTSKFMKEQECSICEMSRLLVRATRMGCSGAAEYLFDKEVHTAFVKKTCKNKNIAKDTENKSHLYV